MIKFENVSKSYEDGTIAVDSLNMEIKKGEFFVLIGPSGCGKTTTLKMINRLIPLSEGTIFFDGNNINEYDIHELRWNIGYVLQQIALFPHMSIEENITVVPEMKKWTKEKMKERAFELMKMVGLDPQKYASRKPIELSGGEQQRVGVIRALAADPEIILMDEPFSALDPISRDKLQDDMLDLKKSLKKTTVFVTHDMQEALKLADRICIMKNGRIVQIGTPHELLSKPANKFVKEFVGNKSGNWIDDVDWEVIIQPMVQSDISQNSTEVIPIATPLKKVLDILANHEQLVVEKDGERIGVINRKAIIQFLSSKMPERGSNK
ncbi:ABC transporter ATP-binding protein [Bacillus niameyensis]|uniref:ABC transporter ATP-binding protein n=1 Tax=Bacillus niameyensis TaxID=1522308 RepID=UPI0007809DAB|nr:ABC transporter ATP-binding protein [Bacillus niameyensis]